MWLYVPNTSTSSQSAPEAEGSISESNWRFQALAQSAWWRGKPSPSRTWFQRWNKVSFIRLLCGAMSEPSMADAGVAAWTASLAASRASRTAWPVESREVSTNATSGNQHGGSSSSPVSGSSSSKTSAACSRRGLTKSLEPSGYGETFASLVSRLRSDCSRRRKSARAMSASAYSSSASATDEALAWPTPSARDWKGANDILHDRGSKGAPLNEIAKVWATPQARDYMPPHSPERIAAMKAEGHGMRNLNDEAATWAPPKWPTPAVTDSFGARNRTSGRSNPDSQHHDGVTLNDAIVLWSTPTQVHRKSEKAMRPFAEGGQSSPPAIEQQAEALTNTLWATPSVADTTGGRMTRSGDRSNEPLLKGQSDTLSSRLHPMLYPVGQVSSHPRRSLNPLFVEWLMGWPPGWTLGVWIDFACSATELSRFKQRMRFALSQLALPAEAPPAQLALFG